MAEVRASSGVPVIGAFAGLGAPTVCAPVVVDSVTGDIYTLKTGDVVVRISAPPASQPYAPGSFTIATEQYAVISKRLQLTGTQRATLAGTSRLRIT